MATTLAVFFLSLFVIEIGTGVDAFADDGDEYNQIIQELAAKYHVESALVKAVIRAESDFDPEAVSPRGARGLMQLMPRIARKHGVANPDDPRQNIRGGVRMLRSLLDRFDHDPKLALAAYNAGGGTVERFSGLPPYRETRDYVRKVLKYRALYLAEDREQPRGEQPRTEQARTEQPERLARRDPALAYAKQSWPRGAETIWYGAPGAADATFQAAFHSLPHPGAEHPSPPTVP